MGRQNFQEKHPKRIQPNYHLGVSKIPGSDKIIVGDGEAGFYLDSAAPAIVAGLVHELHITRELLKEVLRRKGGIHLGAENEIHREISSLAQKVNMHPDDVWDVMVPIIREVVEEALTRKVNPELIPGTV